MRNTIISRFLCSNLDSLLASVMWYKCAENKNVKEVGKSRKNM